MKWTFFPITQFEQLASTWNALSAHAGDLPFLHSRFILPLCDAFGDGNLKIALCENTQGPIAISVLSRRGPAHWESFQPSQSHLCALAMLQAHDYESLQTDFTQMLPGTS